MSKVWHFIYFLVTQTENLNRTFYTVQYVKKKTLSDSTRLALIIIWKYLCES